MVAHTSNVGLMAQPENGMGLALGKYRWWAADNGCYAKGDAFDAGRWLNWLASLDHPETCLFAVAPDVVGDAAKTLKRSRPFLRTIRRLGYKAAYAAQDGSTPETLPWSEFDVLFIGGKTTRWKLSPAAAAVTAEAKRRGMHVHMGRVNSLKRIQAAALMGCDSVDGTYVAFRARLEDRGAGAREVAAWLNALDEQPFLPLVTT